MSPPSPVTQSQSTSPGTPTPPEEVSDTEFLSQVPALHITWRDQAGLPLTQVQTFTTDPTTPLRPRPTR